MGRPTNPLSICDIRRFLYTHTDLVFCLQRTSIHRYLRNEEVRPQWKTVHGHTHPAREEKHIHFSLLSIYPHSSNFLYMLFHAYCVPRNYWRGYISKKKTTQEPKCVGRIHMKRNNKKKPLIHTCIYIMAMVHHGMCVCNIGLKEAQMWEWVREVFKYIVQNVLPHTYP